MTRIEFQSILTNWRYRDKNWVLFRESSTRYGLRTQTQDTNLVVRERCYKVWESPKSQRKNDQRGHTAAKNTTHLCAGRLKPWEYMDQFLYSPQHWLQPGCNASSNFRTSNFKIRESKRELKDHHNPVTILSMLTIQLVIFHTTLAKC